MQAISAQLHAAMVLKGWSVQRLLDASKLECDRTSLQRKLKGKQVLFTQEAERIARVLGARITVSMSKAA